MTTPEDEVRQAAESALQRWDEVREVLERPHAYLAGQSDDAQRDMAAMFTAIAEHLRVVRQSFVDAHGIPEHPAVPSIALSIADEMAATGLPFNRKERYFTGTVLPMIVCSDGFAHFDRLLDMCGVASRVKPGYLGEQELQFFTEYSLIESVFTQQDRLRFGVLPDTKDTPDVMVLGPDWLVAVEAKMYTRPRRDKFQDQIRKQRAIIDAVIAARAASGRPLLEVRHVALIPEGQRAALAVDGIDAVLTWEALADRFRAVAPRYWMGQLDYAIKHDLTAKAGYSDGFRTGRQIRDGELVDKASGASFTFMGVAGGPNGPRLAQEILDGSWIDRAYQVRFAPLDNPNWFPIEDFVAMVTST